MDAPHLVTVCERRRLGQAIVLAESFARHHDGGEVLVVIADEMGEAPSSDGALRIVTGAEAAGEHHGRLAGALPAAELTEALVPFALASVGAPAFYLAPDAWVCAP